VIAGGSGFLGHSLALHLSGLGAKVTILSRSRPVVNGPWEHVAWDARTPGPWMRTLSAAAGLVNIVGRTVDCIKTPAHRDEILRSRVEATRVLGVAVSAAASPPPVWVQMRTAHIYGDPLRVVCDEDSPTELGLAPLVGKAWEEAYRQSVLPTQRRVILRTGFVLGRNRGCGGGALSRLSLLSRLGLGGRVADGTQGMSWIHELDMNRLFTRGLTDSAMQGTYIASGPNPVDNTFFMRELRRTAGGLGALGIGPPAFAWMVRIGAPLLMRTDPELAIYGRYVVSRRLREEGFEFGFPHLRDALADLLTPTVQRIRE